MTNPYRAPAAEVADIQSVRPRRYFQALFAFLSGAVVAPCILYAATRVLEGDAATVPTTILFWIITFTGSLFAFAVVYPFKNIPLWLAVTLGPLVVLSLYVVHVVWLDSVY
jgi:hypothetical protein